MLLILPYVLATVISVLGLVRLTTVQQMQPSVPVIVTSAQVQVPPLTALLIPPYVLETAMSAQEVAPISIVLLTIHSAAILTLPVSVRALALPLTAKLAMIVMIVVAMFV